MGDLTCYFPQSINVNVYESENTLSQPLLSWNYEINRNSSYIPYLSSVTSPLGNSTTFGYTMETGSIAYNYSGDTFKSYYTLKYMLMTSINHPKDVYKRQVLDSTDGKLDVGLPVYSWWTFMAVMFPGWFVSYSTVFITWLTLSGTLSS